LQCTANTASGTISEVAVDIVGLAGDWIRGIKMECPGVVEFAARYRKGVKKRYKLGVFLNAFSSEPGSDFTKNKSP